MTQELDWEELNTAMERNNVVGARVLLEGHAYTIYKDIVDRYQRDDFKDFDFKKMELFLQGLDFIYINGGVSPLRDAEYDELHAIYNEKTGRFITNRFETAKKKVKHVYPELKGTLEKVHYVAEKDKQKNAIKTHRSLEHWVNHALEKLPYREEGYRLGFYKKIDGISVIFAVEDGKVISAITRGDADTGEGTDVTENFKNVTFQVPQGYPKKYGIKTEVVMPKKAFEEYSKKYKSDTRKLEEPRSAASGLVNADYLPPEMLKYLRIIELEHFVDGKFIFPNPSAEMHVSSKSDPGFLHGAIDAMAAEIRDFDTNCDGVVVRFLDPLAITTLGRDVEHSVNKFEVAYKFPPEEKETILKNVEFQIGLLGTVSPVAKVEPVKMKGKTIKSISLGSIDRMNGLHLHIGDEVIIKYEIIPYLDKTKETKGNPNPLILPPEVCPYCGENLEEDPALMCVNKDCPSRVMGKILNYCVKMNIKGVGESTVQDFFNAGILRSIEDLYRLSDHKETIVTMDNYGEKKYDALVKSIRKNNETDAGTLLGSLGIKGIGRTKFKKITGIYYIDELMAMNSNDVPKLCKVPGIGKSTAMKIIEGLAENRETIKFLLDNVKLVKKEGGDYNIVFSGIRNRDFEKVLEAQGYEIKDSVGKKTKFLIVDSLDRETTKTKKAKALGVPLLDIHRAYSVFGYVQ